MGILWLSPGRCMKWSCLKLQGVLGGFGVLKRTQTPPVLGVRIFLGQNKHFLGAIKNWQPFLGIPEAGKKLQNLLQKTSHVHKPPTWVEIATPCRVQFQPLTTRFFVALPNVDISPGNPRFIEREAPPEAVQGDTGKQGPVDSVRYLYVH